MPSERFETLQPPAWGWMTAAQDRVEAADGPAWIGGALALLMWVLMTALAVDWL